ncbi:MAG: hypothetical protein KU37_00105 [Sulfuricurvum sp. PC08-66]|nr:MAG: hypothetical protein KU37_00105 [Sulfuricurvum sp. PC08-66]
MRKVLPWVIVSMLGAGEIEITIEGVKNANGELSIGLYDEAKAFAKPNAKVVKGVFVKASQGTMVVKLVNIPDGVYAVSLFHDQNSNQKLDTNFLGMPIEGYGFSNNVYPMFRSASFEEARFELMGTKEMSISVHY